MSSSACTSSAITGTRFPPAEASSIVARRNRTELVLPRRTICCSFCPSWSVNLRTRTGSATTPPTIGRTSPHIQPPRPPTRRTNAVRALAGIRELFPQVGLVWVDGGYVNSVDAGLVGWAAGHEGLEIVAVPRNADVKGFRVLPRRWVVERTFAWLGRCRRLARDYERKTAHAEAMIKVAMIRLMAARLAGEEIEPRGPIETEAARRLADDLNDQ
ncbi:transposase [Kitasatospora saccharophila]